MAEELDLIGMNLAFTHHSIKASEILLAEGKFLNQNIAKMTFYKYPFVIKDLF